MKLVIQIPCFNEAAHIGETLSCLPRQVRGFDSVEWLVVDDGSDDDTARVAEIGGADHIVRLSVHQGLARAFVTGLEESLRRGADVIVNTDADNQYSADDIPKLLDPIVLEDADLVVGCRPIESIAHFSRSKKCLQRVGSRIVQSLAGVRIIDATSGFRAYSRNAALTLDVFSRYTYTLETTIQAGQSGLKLVSVPIRVNPPTRPSRLAKSSAHYVWQATLTIVRAFVIYRPFRFFLIPAVTAAVLGIGIGVWFLYEYVTQPSAGHVQALILAAILVLGGALTAAVGLLADLLSINRRLLQRMQVRARQIDDRKC